MKMKQKLIKKSFKNLHKKSLGILQVLLNNICFIGKERRKKIIKLIDFLKIFEYNKNRRRDTTEMWRIIERLKNKMHLYDQTEMCFLILSSFLIVTISATNKATATAANTIT